MTDPAGQGWPEEARRVRSEVDPERRRLYARRYREAHPDRIAASSLAYREKTRERAKQREQERSLRRRQKQEREIQRQEREIQQRERKRSYNRRYAEAHRDVHRQSQRAYLARRLAEDPIGFREHRNLLQQRWYRRHNEEIKAKARDSYRTDPTPFSERDRRYYERHAAEIKQRRREAYQKDPEKILAYNREWKARERRRKAVGLPPRRMHRVRPAERDLNSAAADEFFSRTRTSEERQNLRTEWITVREVHQRNKREEARARATDYARGAEMTARRKEELRRQDAGLRANIMRELAEAGPPSQEARMDDIARAINAQLRSRPQRRAHHNDPAAPRVSGSSPETGGLSR